MVPAGKSADCATEWVGLEVTLCIAELGVIFQSALTAME